MPYIISHGNNWDVPPPGSYTEDHSLMDKTKYLNEGWLNDWRLAVRIRARKVEMNETRRYISCYFGNTVAPKYSKSWLQSYVKMLVITHIVVIGKHYI